MKRLYFIIGSQDLYGAETLRQVAVDGQKIAQFLDTKLNDVIRIEYQPVVLNSQSIKEVCQRASNDSECIGVITWMHTFSPAKMWIKGLQLLTKPLLHLHTQANEKLPYDKIDMDFMNLNQSAHGDREYSFICTRLGIKREIVVGYYENSETIDNIRRFAEVAKAIDYSKNLKVAMFGSNMREVAVTDGDRVESQIKYGWEVNYFGIGELVELIEKVTEEEVLTRVNEYRAIYDLNTDKLDSVCEQAKYDIALERFLTAGNFNAFTDTFQDLFGMKQLPGLATQRQMARGIGFGAEGDYKTSALNAVLNKMAECRAGATGFMEDYTYDLTSGSELVLGAHMLEISPVFAASKPSIEVHALSIGGKESPARLVFDGVAGNAISVCMTDMGSHFRLIAAEIELIDVPNEMPNLPVARLMWRVKPNFVTGVKEWLKAGGGHHTVVSTALRIEDIQLFSELTDTELIIIK